jgi:hypothetical protein
MTTVEILKAARAKIEQGWTQKALARDAYGDPARGNGCSWCAEGALVAVTGGRSKAFGYLRESLPDGFNDTAIYNDAPGRTQQEILDLYDAAIARAEAEEAK